MVKKENISDRSIDLLKSRKIRLMLTINAHTKDTKIVLIEAKNSIHFRLMKLVRTLSD